MIPIYAIPASLSLIIILLILMERIYKSQKYFFGWDNIKWIVKEIVKMYSDQPSYFSKKRIESGIAFIILQWGLIRWMVLRINIINSTDLLMWASIEAAICGYILSHIQNEKRGIDGPNK